MGSGKEGEEDEITKLHEVHLHTSTHFYYALWGRVRARFKKTLDATKIRMRCNGMGWDGMEWGQHMHQLVRVSVCLTLALASTSAPASMSNGHAASRPHTAATCRGVQPDCMDE